MLKLSLSVLAAVIVGLGAVAFYLDSIAARTLRSATESATGVPVSIGGTRVQLIAGRLQVRDLEISNPEGYSSPSFFTFEELHFEVRPQALLGDPIRISEITIDGVELTLERKGLKTNAGVILANLTAAGRSGATEPSEAPGPGVIIETLVLQNARATVRLVPGKDTTLKLPPIRLTGIGRGEGEVVSIAQVVTIVLTATIEAVARNPGAVPSALRAELTRHLESARSAGLGWTLRGTGRALFDEVEKGSREGARRVLKGVGRLLGRDD